MAMDFLTSDATFEEKVIYALSELNTKMEGLVGNGQPGKVQLMEVRLTALETRSNQGHGARGFVHWIVPIVISLLALLVAYAKGH